jgi:ankyrin repeat protein
LCRYASGAPVNGVAQWSGRTPLIAAAESDGASARECCEVLLAAGADADFVSGGVVGRRLGYGAVHAAAARMDPALVRVLIHNGADPNRRAKNTDTKEVKSRRAAAARALWGSATAHEHLENTPLHLAVAAYINEAAKRRGVAAYGAGAGANGNSKNNEKSAGEKAALEVIEILLALGADHGAYVVDSTPMHMAALGGAVDVIDLLMENGAEVDAAAPNGCTTPLEAAARYAADIIIDYHSNERESSENAEILCGGAEPPHGILGAAGGESKSKGSHNTSRNNETNSSSSSKSGGGGGQNHSRKNDGAAAGGKTTAEKHGGEKGGGGGGGCGGGGGGGSAAAAAASGNPSDAAMPMMTLTDEAAALAALRDAAAPLRAVQHLATRWGAAVTTAALVGVCRSGDEDTASCLLDAAAARHVSKAGRSPEELVKDVISLHAYAMARSTTPLHAAAESGCVPVARLLLEWGADIEQRRPDDDATPLFLAARAGRPGMIAFLFSQGGDIEVGLCTLNQVDP